MLTAVEVCVCVCVCVTCPFLYPSSCLPRCTQPTAGPDSSSAPLKQEHEKEYEDSPPTPSLYESANFEPDERLLDLSPRTTSRPEGGGGGVAGERGLVVVTFSDARLFIASGYLGDASHDYLCGQVGSEIL